MDERARLRPASARPRLVWLGGQERRGLEEHWGWAWGSTRIWDQAYEVRTIQRRNWSEKIWLFLATKISRHIWSFFLWPINYYAGKSHLNCHYFQNRFMPWGRSRRPPRPWRAWATYTRPPISWWSPRPKTTLTPSLPSHVGFSLQIWDDEINEFSWEWPFILLPYHWW